MRRYLYGSSLLVVAAVTAALLATDGPIWP
jgi:hypothetical protein